MLVFQVAIYLWGSTLKKQSSVTFFPNIITTNVIDMIQQKVQAHEHVQVKPS